MSEPTEDIDYTSVDEFAIPEEENKAADSDQPNKSILVEVLEELEKDIALNNSFEVIHTPANATPEQKMAAFDEIAIHKGLALHLHKYKIMISNKIKELK